MKKCPKCKKENKGTWYDDGMNIAAMYYECSCGHKYTDKDDNIKEVEKVKPIKKQEERCSNCGAELKTKYMIRVITNQEDIHGRKHFESRTRKSVVGWIKHIVDNITFEEIEIINLLKECQVHEEHYKNKLK